MRLPSARDGGAVLLLALLALLLLRKAVLGGVLFERDVHLVWLPQMEVLVRAVAGGAWPLWNPSAGFGDPLLANPEAQVLYPFTWLNLICPPATFYTLFAVAHLILGGLGVRALARTMRLSPPAAAAAGALWMAAGPVLSLVNLWHHYAGACWMPWVLAAAEWTFRTRRLGPALGWAGAQALQVLAGSADMCAATILLSAGRLLCYVRWKTPSSRRNLRLAGLATLALVLGLGASAAQWMPTVDVARRSARWGGLTHSAREYWSVHPMLLAQTVLPLFPDELPLRPHARELLYEGREPFLRSLYLGLPALALVVASLQERRRRRLVLLLLLVAAVGAFLALGRHGPLHELAVRVFPPMRIFRYPVKAMVPVALVWALLAGVGVDAWRRGTSRARTMLLALGGALGLLAVARPAARPPAWVSSAVLDGHPAGADIARTAWPAVLALAALAALAHPVVRSRFGAAVGLAAAGLAVMELGVTHRDLNPVAPARLMEVPPLVSALRSAGAQRVYVYEYFTVPGKARQYLGRDKAHVLTAMPVGWDIRAVETLELHRYLYPPMPGAYALDGSFDMDVRGLYPAHRVQMARLVRAVEGTPAHLRVLQLAAVDALVALHQQGLGDLTPLAVLPGFGPEPVRAFRVPDPLPRTYAVGASVRADGGAALALLVRPDFDPRRTVVLADGPEQEAPAGFAGSSRIIERRADRVALRAELAAAGFVVLAESWETGWRAWLVGRPVPVRRANGTFRAVEVPAGVHVIEFRYRPPAAIWGAIVSTSSLLTGAVLAWRSRTAAPVGVVPA